MTESKRLSKQALMLRQSYEDTPHSCTRKGTYQEVNMLEGIVIFQATQHELLDEQTRHGAARITIN